MNKLLSTTLLLLAFGWVTHSFAAVTQAQCDHDYDSCKKKHIFDKKPCKKRRDNCFAQLNEQVAAEQKAGVKNRMMSGATQTTGTSMRDLASGEAQMTEAQKKAAAKKRMMQRQEAKAAEGAETSSGMRDAVKSN